MVHPDASEVRRLRQVADEIRATTDESGYAVTAAIGQHTAFGKSRGPASALERSLVLEAARRGASAAGLQTEEISGSLDVVAIANATIRRYRVKRVKVSPDGLYEVLCGEGSSLLVADPDSVFLEEKWILGYVISDDHTIEHLLAAEIVGWHGDGPVYLDFGTIIDLSEVQPPRGFTSSDEELEGFVDESRGAGSADAV